MVLNISNKTQKILIIAGIIGPIFYFTLLTILGLIWKGYNPILTGMSEIGAVDSPFKDIMNYLGFSLLGICIILFDLAFKTHFKENLQMTIVFIVLLIGGIFMFLVGFLPCDPDCIDVTLTGTLHSITSTIPAVLIPIAAIISAYPFSKLWGLQWGYCTFILGLLSLSSGPFLFFEFLSNFTGLIQRLGIGLSLFWIFITSLKIYNELRN